MPAPTAEVVEQVHRPRRGLRVRPRSAGNYTQHSNIVYAESEGVGLVMDVFQPKVAANGRAIVDVISSAWRSGRPQLNEHIGMGAIDALCEAGFTVFAAAPGSATLFTAQQMVEHVHAAIRYVRDVASSWDVESTKVGLAGVSAGAHLAALTALGPQLSDTKARQSWFHHGTAVDAVGLFFPPTDFVDYGGQPFNFRRDGDFAIPRLLFPNGNAGRGAEEIVEAAKVISPIRHVSGNHPPFFVAHATGDPVVPYSQSLQFVNALSNVGVETKLVTHEGDGHPWKTVSQECAQMSMWFRQHLLT